MTQRLDQDVVALVDDCNHFANSLYSRISQIQDGNVILSPSSLSLAVAMTMAGANGETAEEIADVLRISLPNDRVHEAFQQLRSETKTGGVELRIANRLWGQQGYPFHSEFLATTDRCYDATLAEVDFQHDHEQARQSINNWIDLETAHKIPELIGSGMLGEETRLVLTNAVYFLGTWEQEFDVERTHDVAFFVNCRRSASVQMMEQTDMFQYGEFDDLQVLEMSYRSQGVSFQVEEDGDAKFVRTVDIPGRGSDFSMCVLLPRIGIDLVQLESQLSPGTLQKWTTLQTSEVHVTIPRFRIELGVDMTELLTGMGMERAFTPSLANFTPMTPHPAGMFLGSVVHRAFVDVNERGTEAAAATGILMAAGCAMEPEPPKEFRADRPFLFLIRDRRTKQIHFMGRVTEPAAEE